MKTDVKNKIKEDNAPNYNDLVLEELRVLNHGIRSADDRLRKYARPSRIFLRGMVSGVGATIGASLFAGLIFLIVSRIFNLFNIPLEVSPINPELQKASLGLLIN